MALGASEQPLIPPPPAIVAALRQAIAQVCPAALPAFTRELDQAADQARLGSDLSPLRRFSRQWAIYVHIQRQPQVAARFRELEDNARTGDAAQARAAAAELGRILDQAQTSLAEDGSS